MPVHSRTHSTMRSWMWALLPLLLAAALVVPALGRDVFDVDESATMISAGARHIGPYTPAEAVAASARWPDQGWGNVVVYSLWGRVVGWSEFAIRALPWLTGLLTLACSFRIGRDLFSLRIALTATLLLATSVLFLTYMHNIRSYGPAMLFAATILWSYWRVALYPHPPGRGARFALLSGATGLLYSHYFSALLLPALALFHLFFVRKERRWWQTVFLLGLAALFALPQISDLLEGIKLNLGKGWLHEDALGFSEVFSLFLRHLSSGLLNVQQPVSTLIVLALPFLLVVSGWRKRQRRQPPGAACFLLLTCTITMLLLLGVNEWLQVFDKSRSRYLTAMLPIALLLISLALLHTRRALLRPPVGLVMVALVALMGASDFLHEGELVQTYWSWRKVPATIASTREILQEEYADGLLAVDKELFRGTGRMYEFYTGVYAERRVSLNNVATSAELLERAQGFDNVWILLRSSREPIRSHVNRFWQEGWFMCRSWQEAGVTLKLLLSPVSTNLAAKCPDSPVSLKFDAGIRLMEPEIDISDDLLRLAAHFHSADDYLLANYSLAVHIIDLRTGERIAQGDTGVGPGAIVPLRSEIDISALPPGDYEVRVALYDWQTGARILARDLETDEVSDMHTLHRFSHN